MKAILNDSYLFQENHKANRDETNPWLTNIKDILVFLNM